MASYAYDWREQRVASSSQAGGDRHFFYGDDGELLAEYDAQSGALVREFIWLDAMPLVMVNGPPASPTYTWITTGNLGEPLLLTDAAGAVVSSVTRDPWGNRVLLAGGDPLDLGYPGQWRDGASGLFQNHHRDYDPITGRYIEADPLGLGGGSNLYAYVGGDPINAVDPDGRRLLHGIIFNGLTLALMNVNGQLLANGGRLDCIDWSSVGRDAAIGGALGGIGGLIAPRIAGLGAKLPRFGRARPLGRPSPGSVTGASPVSPAPSAASPTKAPMHHICTNKNCISPNFGGPWTPRFEALFDKAGISMENAINKVRIPGHFGPHPQAYHELVFYRLETATLGLDGQAFTNAFRTELGAMRQELLQPGSPLYNLLMGL